MSRVAHGHMLIYISTLVNTMRCEIVASQHHPSSMAYTCMYILSSMWDESLQKFVYIPYLHGLIVSTSRASPIHDGLPLYARILSTPLSVLATST